MTIAFVPDLMDRSKVAAAFGDVRFVTSADALVADAGEIVIVDLMRPDAAAAASRAVAAGARVIAFAPHRETVLADAARAAGCERVLTRSAFFGRLSEIAAELR